MNGSDVDLEINDYIVRYLIRYFREAEIQRIKRPKLEIGRDLELIRMHWAFSAPVRSLIEYLAQHPHDLQRTLEFQQREEDAVVRGRLDARSTIIQRAIRGVPTLTICYEPLRSFRSGPNQLLMWVLEEAWRLLLRFSSLLPPDATYRLRVDTTSTMLERIRRFASVRTATVQVALDRRPAHSALKQSARSRQPIYVLAFRAYDFLSRVEQCEEESLLNLLKDTLLGPLPIWKRFELAVGLGAAEALAVASNKRAELAFLVGGSQQPIAEIGTRAIFWQSRTDYYASPKLEPSEILVRELLEKYGLDPSGDRPDFVVVNNAAASVQSIIEAKFFADEESSGADALRGAIEQLVRYARGYREPSELLDLLDSSCVALVRENFSVGQPKPYGLPWLVDLAGIKRNRLLEWAQALCASG
jgi:hypothetical protein